METLNKFIAKRTWAPVAAAALLVVIAVSVIVSPRIRLSMASGGYESHTTCLIYDLQEDVGSPVRLKAVSTLTAKGNPKVTAIAYFPGAQQIAFGVVGAAKAIEGVPFVFKIKDSQDAYLDFNVVASEAERYWGDRLLPFYLSRVPLAGGQQYVLEVYAGATKQSEITFEAPVADSL